MPKRAKLALLAVLTVVLVASFAGVALAAVPPSGGWTDLRYSIVGKYGITLEQVGMISDGYTDGSWKPYNDVPRKQFIKMAVDAYKIPLKNPATPSFSDVPASDLYYQYIEGAKAAGLTNGFSNGQFMPNATITREQAAAIIVRWVAAKNGYDPATMYTDDEAAAILAVFPDGSSVSASLKKEIAFAVDFGVIWGTADGKLAPAATMTRIQGAAMIIRSWAIIPPVPSSVPADVALVSADKAENLIGQVHTATFKVTDEDGAPVAGVLVDFDTLINTYWYVGNVSSQAALTDDNGEVTVNLLSTEVGTQRVSASVRGEAGAIYTTYVTKYWVALDEVYVLDKTRSAQNNAGYAHEWAARVVVFGPGPLSTSAQDWYNAYDPSATGALAGVDWPVGWVLAMLNTYYHELLPLPGFDDWPNYDGLEEWVDDFVAAHGSMPINGMWDVVTLVNSLLAIDRWTYDTELLMGVHGYLPRSLAGIPMYWEIDEATETADASIIDGGEDASIAEDGKSAWVYSDEDGMTWIELNSTKTGSAAVSVIADYAENPYPGQLFNHLTNQSGGHMLDWDDQPQPQAWATKTWIAHDPGAGESAIDPAYQYANIGEEFILTLTLVDAYGNPVDGRQVEWTMQGIGHFITDDGNTITDPTDPAGNKDIDVTDAAGQCRVMVKSLEPGEQIVHAKWRTKGIDGSEGQFVTNDAEVQWFDVNVVTFDDPATTRVWDYDADEDEGYWVPVNEAWSANMVGDSHTFTLNVMGLKLEMDPDVWDPQRQTAIIDTDYPGAAYDGVFDWRDAAYFGGILLINQYELIDGWPEDVNGNGVIDDNLYERGTAQVYVQGRWITVTGVGGIVEYDWDDDAYLEEFDGVTGIYLPLPGKDVTFDLANMVDVDLSNLGVYFDGMDVDAVGSYAPEQAVTDENGQAQVSVSSNIKGPETIQASVDWEHNPHNMSELLQAYAKKLWMAADAVDIVVTIDGDEVANNTEGDVGTAVNPWYVWDPELEEYVLNSAHIEVHVYDAFGNDLPDYEVVYLLENLEQTLYPGGQAAASTYLPRAYFVDKDTENLIEDAYGNYWPYDINGTRPDADEPYPWSDPYAYIVGDEGTEAFFFNQWLSSAATTGEGHDGYVRWPLNQAKDPAMLDGIGEYALVTDGAKAWTLDGYFEPNWDDAEQEPLAPNLLTGSNIDVQLAEDYTTAMAATHFKSIVKVMVYAPADGLVIDQAPIWEYQVHKVWLPPVELLPTAFTLEQSIDGGVTWTDADLLVPIPATVELRAQVIDQFGNYMPNTDVTAWNGKLFIDSDLPGGDILYDINTETSPITDQLGYIYGTIYVGEAQTVVGQAWLTDPTTLVNIYTNDIRDIFATAPVGD